MLVYGKNVLMDIDIKKIRKVYLSENFHNKSVFDYLKENNVHYFLCSRVQMDKMVNDNIVDDDFVVALDHLEDVHNFGAIIRTCEAAGVKNILIPKDRSVRINDVVMKTSAGALDRVHIVVVSNLCEALKKLQKKNYFVYSSFMDGEDYRTLDYSGKKVLVIGNEGKGVSKVVENITDVRVGIPMTGKVNSLNASVAAGILIFAMK